MKQNEILALLQNKEVLATSKISGANSVEYETEMGRITLFSWGYIMFFPKTQTFEDDKEQLQALYKKALKLALIKERNTKIAELNKAQEAVDALLAQEAQKQPDNEPKQSDPCNDKPNYNNGYYNA